MATSESTILPNRDLPTRPGSHFTISDTYFYTCSQSCCLTAHPTVNPPEIIHDLDYLEMHVPLLAVMIPVKHT